MICPFCGQKHPDTTKFCPETGKDLESQIWVCNNPDCTYRSQLPMTAKYCPHCGEPLGTQGNLNKVEMSESAGNWVIIAYERADEEDGYDDNQKYITVFKDNNENVIYSGVVYNRDYNISLRESILRVWDKSVIQFSPWSGDGYIEVSIDGVKDNLTSDSILQGNFYGNRECNGFDVTRTSRLKSTKTGRLYDDVYDSFLIKRYEDDGLTYLDIFDRYSEELLHHHIKLDVIGCREHCEFKFWLDLYNEDNTLLLVNKFNMFSLEENEVVVKNYMYDSTWRPEYSEWFYGTENRVLTTFRYDDYEPNFDGIRTIRMRNEKGNIIKEIDANGLFLKKNFKFNRCLAIKTEIYRKVLVYIDESGNVDEIPNSIINGEPEDVDCFFVSQNVIVINDKDDATMMTTRGEVIFECTLMSELPGGFVEFYSDGHSGVMDSNGVIIIPAEYDDFDVLIE